MTLQSMIKGFFEKKKPNYHVANLAEHDKILLSIEMLRVDTKQELHALYSILDKLLTEKVNQSKGKIGIPKQHKTDEWQELYLKIGKE